MKKYIISVLLLSAGFSFAFAQTSDVDTSNDNSCAIITSNLRYLSRDTNGSTDVSILQDFLSTRGYLKSQPTGFFGSATRRAVIAFQNDNGLRATPPGYVGPGTRAKIKEIDCNDTSAVNTAPVTTPVTYNNTPTYTPPTTQVTNNTYPYQNPTTVTTPQPAYTQPATYVAPTITVFGNKDPNPTTGATYLMWNTSKPASVSLDMSCNPGTVSFVTDKGNRPSCEKGGVWNWQGQSADGILVTPSGNTTQVTVPFTLTMSDPSGDYSKRQTQTLYVTFPATAQTAPTITAFGNKDPNPTTGATVIMWNTSKVASNSNGFMDVTLDVSCTPGSISFTTNKGNNPICEKGGIWAWSNTNGDSITVTPVGNTVPVTVPFTLTLNDPSGDYSKRQTQTINITFPAVR